MIYRSDLVEHFDWLAGSEYFDEVIDEALIAIAMVAHGHEGDLVQSGGAWWMANGLVEYFRLEEFVAEARKTRALTGA
jgi:hypothetical protein